MPGGGQPKQGLNNVAQMHTHESRISGRGVAAWPAEGSALWECKTKQMDSSYLCGLPLVTHWEMFPYCIKEHQLLHWSREGSLGYSIYLILVFFPLLPSCLSFVKDATENTERSAEKHRSPAAWREFYSYMTRSFSVINIARAEIKDFLKF